MASAAVAMNRRKSQCRPKEDARFGLHGLLERMSSRSLKAAAIAPLVDSPEKLNVETAPTEEPVCFWKYQKEANWLYTHLYSQVFVAVLIASNFLANIVEAQVAVNPKTARTEVRVFRRLEQFFFWVFWAELLLNMYSSWFYRFWSSGWNVFDFVVVLVTTVDVVGLLDPNSPLGLLRMMRAFRVFRLFKRVKSLNKIVVSLGKAMPGVVNAFFILLLVMCIYAILGYQFFAQMPCAAQGGPYACNALDKSQFDIHTEVPPPRLCTKQVKPGYGMLQECRATYTFGHEYFGNFLKSLYTLFQVLTGDSWSEAIGRPLLELSPVSALYFISFVLICAIVLINVVVAVLLEKMVEDEPEDDDDHVVLEDPATNNRGITTRDDAFVPPPLERDGVSRLGSTRTLLRQQAAVQDRLLTSLSQMNDRESSARSAVHAKLDAMQKQLDDMAGIIAALAGKCGSVET
ncbi:hypothetical protein CTAYLR_007547 [Chrysophaeum taylorii]|uniref:Ion transport domain-containing protein n=1 Tax=Chrysophaeum taylorii TaxID=2483200 RepID=A0AAD7XHG1_9STRA|nr:hypothetical protein CTAYLR_007547 [Chrysophaeum taylorii]